MDLWGSKVWTNGKTSKSFFLSFSFLSKFSSTYSSDKPWLMNNWLILAWDEFVHSFETQKLNAAKKNSRPNRHAAGSVIMLISMPRITVFLFRDSWTNEKIYIARTNDPTYVQYRKRLLVVTIGQRKLLHTAIRSRRKNCPSLVNVKRRIEKKTIVETKKRLHGEEKYRRNLKNLAERRENWLFGIAYHCPTP